MGAIADCVNCVRWSPCNGEYLACAGDDQVVTIWQFAGRVNSAGTIGSTTVNVEQYRSGALTRHCELHLFVDVCINCMGIRWMSCMWSGRGMARCSRLVRWTTR